MQMRWDEMTSEMGGKGFGGSCCGLEAPREHAVPREGEWRESKWKKRAVLKK